MALILGGGKTGGGSLPDPFVVTGTDPVAYTATIVGAAAQANNLLVAQDSNNAEIFKVGPPVSGQLVYSPDPNDNTIFRLGKTTVLFKDTNGNEWFSYSPSQGRLALDPNFAVYVQNGLKQATTSEPPDAEFAFNGCFAFYLDGSVLKAKAKIDGSYVHLTIGIFT